LCWGKEEARLSAGAAAVSVRKARATVEVVSWRFVRYSVSTQSCLYVEEVGARNVLCAVDPFFASGFFPLFDKFVIQTVFYTKCVAVFSLIL
jgi:hypothetical protein